MKREKLRAFREPSASGLAQFRRDVQTLKREGLLPPKRSGKTVNTRYAHPSDMVQGKPLREWVQDPDVQAVLDREAVTIAKSRVSDVQGYKVKRPGHGATERIIIPVPKDAKVSTEKKNIVIRHETEEGSITRVALPRKNLQQYLSDANSLPDLPPNGEWYAFYFYGNRSHQIFRSTEHLNQYLSGYNALNDKPQAAFRNLEIVRIKNNARDWTRKVTESVRKRRRGRRTPRTYEQERARLERMPEWKQQIYRAKRAEYQRQYRAKHQK